MLINNCTVLCAWRDVYRLIRAQRIVRNYIATNPFFQIALLLWMFMSALFLICCSSEGWCVTVQLRKWNKHVCNQSQCGEQGHFRQEVLNIRSLYLAKKLLGGCILEICKTMSSMKKWRGTYSGSANTGVT